MINLLWKIIKKFGFIKNKLRHINPDLNFLLSQLISSHEIKVFIDVGANIGQTIDNALKNYTNSEVYSFEPTPELYECLKTKYILNNKVHISNFALSDNNGKSSFFVSEFSPTNSLLKPNIDLYSKFNHKITPLLDKSKEIIIETIKLDNWYNRYLKNRIVDIIKIDTQGFEYNVLCGGRNTIEYWAKILILELQCMHPGNCIYD